MFVNIAVGVQEFFLLDHRSGSCERRRHTQALSGFPPPSYDGEVAASPNLQEHFVCCCADYWTGGSSKLCSPRHARIPRDSHWDGRIGARDRPPAPLSPRYLHLTVYGRRFVVLGLCLSKACEHVYFLPQSSRKAWSPACRGVRSLKRVSSIYGIIYGPRYCYCYCCCCYCYCGLSCCPADRPPLIRHRTGIQGGLSRIPDLLDVGGSFRSINLKLTDFSKNFIRISPDIQRVKKAGELWRVFRVGA